MLRVQTEYRSVEFRMFLNYNLFVIVYIINYGHKRGVISGWIGTTPAMAERGNAKLKLFNYVYFHTNVLKYRNDVVFNTRANMQPISTE